MTPRNTSRKMTITHIILLSAVFILFQTAASFASESNPEPSRASTFSAASGVPGGGGGSAGSGGNATMVPDLFTGSFSYSIPIEVAPGRKGVQPNLALTYRSNSGNSWLGAGWDLEIGAIERSTKDGVKYGTDDRYVLRMNGAAIDLMNIGGDEYRARIESGFLKITKYADNYGGIYWIVRDKAGTQYLYGQSHVSRQVDPADHNPAASNRVFKWGLDRVVDTNGNYMTIHYFDQAQGQIYPYRIEYTGNSQTGQAPTNNVQFVLESRPDAPSLYTTNFEVSTAYRLKEIKINGGGVTVRKYVLEYDAELGTPALDSSGLTGRSLLGRIRQYAKNGVDELPVKTFTYQAASGESQEGVPFSVSSFNAGYWASPDYNSYQQGDFNGDGKVDVLHVTLDAGNNVLPNIWFSQESGSFQVVPLTGPSLGSCGYWINMCLNGILKNFRLGDFNGDGKTDVLVIGWYVDENGSPLTQESWYTTLWLSNGDGTFAAQPAYSTPIAYRIGDTQLGDFNGDGKTDLFHFDSGSSATVKILLSSGDGTFMLNEFTPWSGYGNEADSFHYRFGDFNGDGKTDIAHLVPDLVNIWLSKGDGTFEVRSHYPDGDADVGANNYHYQTGDFNGDGKTDLIHFASGSTIRIWLSNGDWTFTIRQFSQSGYDFSWNSYNFRTGDFNGDGMTDLLHFDSELFVNFWLSQGNGSFIRKPTGYSPWSGYAISTNNYNYQSGDFNGDGRTDLTHILSGSSANVWLSNILALGALPDSLIGIDNGIGGVTSINYLPSTRFTNTFLPFPVQLVNYVATDDGNNLDDNNIPSITSYTYSGGYYHIGKRDFRGFSSVKVWGPVDSQGKGTITETWFHQGDDTAVDANTPEAEEAYMKGKPYRAQVTDRGGAIYAETETTYLADGTAPFFNPPRQVVSYTCDGKLSGACAGNPAAQKVKTVYYYNATYGNVVREDQWGDANPNNTYDDRTIVRTYALNAGAWIVGLPAKETVYEGLYPGVSTANLANLDPSLIKAQTTFYYDHTSDCGIASGSQFPIKGNLTRIVRRFDGVSDPETRMAYDAYGNLKCSRDAAGNTTKFGYDATFTFLAASTTPTTANLPAGSTTTTTYYSGAYGEPGLYGQVKSVTDSNNQTTTMEYDGFGRKKKVTTPDGATTTWDYVSFGAPGSQNIFVDTSEGMTSWAYFDGLGRTILQVQDGPDNQFIYTKTYYNPTGTVKQQSLPGYNPNQLRYTTYSYDPLGRVLIVDNPDWTRSRACYRNGVTVGIDANGHRKRQTRDAQGRLVKVEEFTGSYTNCDNIDEGTVYATTLYTYEAMGNLLTVTDDSGNKTIMTYDTLGRKKTMVDPDMGYWVYDYYANGNLWKQTDAKNNTITFYYDGLNRITKKDYPTGTDVEYFYDTAPGSLVTTYPVGRLSTMTDASGSTKYYYDKMGRTAAVTKRVDNVDYTTQYAYDGLGRTKRITYPDPYGNDGEVIRYDYNTGGGLWKVANNSDNTNYAVYSGYNALGQPAYITFKNGVHTTYTYRVDNDRLETLLTSKDSTNLLDLSYAYDNVGNIEGITDNTPRVQAPFVSETASYEYGTAQYGSDHTQPHALWKNATTGETYAYDDNGNMKTDGTRTITYDYDNKPTSVTVGSATTTFVYDGSGARVKKTASVETVYIGKLYECTAGTCVKYIYAGGQKIAQKVAGTDETVYYHSDHLGSTSVITDGTGASVGNMQYAPFGEARNDPQYFPARHLYTSQEYDAETGLYYYNARYYNPAIGRFISADTIVPNPQNPQAFNRYSYVANNPLRYIDPSGHSWHSKQWRTLGKSVVVGVVGGAVFVATGGMAAPMLAGMAAGVASGAAAGAMSGGGIDAIIVGAGMGGAMGFVGGGAMQFGGPMAGYGMLAGGAGYSYSKGGMTGLAYFGGGVMGGMAGAYLASPSPAGAGGPSGSKSELHYEDPNGQQYTNPTGGELRGCDAQGCGNYGAERGNRVHMGIDIESEIGQNVVAPTGGRVTVDKWDPNGVDIAGQKHYFRALHMKPSEAIMNAGAGGVRVQAGDVIGTGMDLTSSMPGITNHVHLEMYGYSPWRNIDPTPFIFGR